MLRAAVLMAGLATAGLAETRVQIVDFADLSGWAEDDLTPALTAFRTSCGDIPGPDWATLCAIAKDTGDARAFFELFFQPVIVSTDAPALFTGYFEPLLNGSRTRTGRFRYPLYRQPPESRETRPWLTRKEIETGGIMQGRGLDIAWVDDPVDLFFLQIQGSGRVRLTNGQIIRVGYGGHNGHPYSSVGQRLVDRDLFKPHQVSAPVIRNWVRANPGPGLELLRETQSYVFFRELRDHADHHGPLGAMNRPLTPLRSLAVDPKHITLGTPVWIEKSGAAPMARLMIAQDTGSAIKGAQRADIFYGSGDAAGRTAGAIKDGGRLVQLLPIQRAFGLRPLRVK